MNRQNQALFDHLAALRAAPDFDEWRARRRIPDSFLDWLKFGEIDDDMRYAIMLAHRFVIPRAKIEAITDEPAAAQTSTFPQAPAIPKIVADGRPPIKVCDEVVLPVSVERSEEADAVFLEVSEAWRSLVDASADGGCAAGISAVDQLVAAQPLALREIIYVACRRFRYFFGPIGNENEFRRIAEEVAPRSDTIVIPYGGANIIQMLQGVYVPTVGWLKYDPINFNFAAAYDNKMRVIYYSLHDEGGDTYSLRLHVAVKTQTVNAQKTPTAEEMKAVQYLRQLAKSA